MISQLVFHYIEHLLLYPPFKRIKVFWALSSEKILESCQPDMRPFLSLTLWTSHELSWPYPSPRTHSCVGYFTVKTLRDCFLFSGYLDNSAGLNACLGVNSRKHASTLQTFSRHCKYSFGVRYLPRLTSVMSISEKKWTDSIRSNILT